MDFVIQEKDYIQMIKDNPLQDITDNILREISDDLRICMMAGVKIDTTFENGKIIIKTHYPVSILRDEKGNVISVLQKK